MPLGKEVGLVPGRIVLDGDPAPTAAPAHFWPTPTVAKRSPISATAELLLTSGQSSLTKAASQLHTDGSVVFVRWLQVPL